MMMINDYYACRIGETQCSAAHPRMILYLQLQKFYEIKYLEYFLKKNK